MNDTNDDAEFFDATPVSPGERGESFNLTPGCYGRMARAALRAMTYAGVEPVLIRRLKGVLGCELVLYGRASAYRLRVSSHTSPAQIELHALALDSIESGPGSLILSGCDEPQSWHRVTDLMVWREGVAGSDELDEWQEISDQLRESNDWWSWK